MALILLPLVKKMLFVIDWSRALCTPTILSKADAVRVRATNQSPKENMKPKPAPDPTFPEVETELDTDVLISEAAWTQRCADPKSLCQRATQAGFAAALADGIEMSAPRAEVAVFLGNDRHIRDLNRDYRGIDKPTNVLSFASLDEAGPGHQPEGAPLLLGDIIVAFETVDGEALSENKTIDAHLAHMIVHGTLHLMGYDHETELDAGEMERLEITALARLGVADPYALTEPIRTELATATEDGRDE